MFMHSFVMLVALDGSQIFLVGPFIDVRLTLHIALAFTSDQKKKKNKQKNENVFLALYELGRGEGLKLTLASCP